MSTLIEPGPIPMKTDDGNILLIFAAYDGTEYTISQALISGEDPTRVLDHLDSPFLGPETDAATTGFVDNVVFPEGIAIHDGTVFLYFGMADSRIGVATHALGS